MSEPLFLSTAQVAKLLAVSSQTIVNMRKEGRGPKYIQISERKFRYLLPDLIDYVDSIKTQ